MKYLLNFLLGKYIFRFYCRSQTFNHKRFLSEVSFSYFCFFLCLSSR
uniref:Uncharacterized protein n=1 Tax=Myoviridae sp. ctBtT5 TaxID=2825048 RepID=A0A8S5PYY7_9CAUD|nr:MAG TPA: hypothetical protein [Myoviridae sp. ctBtT5]